MTSSSTIMMSDSDSEGDSESMPVSMASESVYKRSTSSSTGRKRVVTKERADKGVQGVRVVTKETRRKERADKGVQGVRVVTKERKERSDKGQKRKRSESVTPTLDGPSATARITEEYGKQYMTNLRFLTCACCAFDGPRGTFKELADLHAMGSLLWHRQCKAMIVQALRESTSIGAHYDHIYAEVLNKELTADGLLPGLKYVCKKCFTDLKKTRGKDLEDVGAYVRAMFDDDGICNDDSDNDDDSDDEAEEVNEDERCRIIVQLYTFLFLCSPSQCLLNLYYFIFILCLFLFISKFFIFSDLFLFILSIFLNVGSHTVYTYFLCLHSFKFIYLRLLHFSLSLPFYFAIVMLPLVVGLCLWPGLTSGLCL